MRSLLNFLARHLNFILFLLLEGAALTLIINDSNYHNARITKGVRGLTRRLEEKITNVRDYLILRDINTRLSIDIATLRNEMQRMYSKDSTLFFSDRDFTVNQNYEYIVARTVNNSVNRQKNFFTLNKGSRQGITLDMGVISQEGVAGIIIACSENYSLAMSLINIDFRLSSRIRSNGYFGSLTWDGRDYRYAVLNDIPQHVIVQIGDTIETTSYSAIFPEGLMVGQVSDISRSGSDFYRITVRLSTDFRRLNYVDIIKNNSREEQIILEEKLND